MRKESVGEPPDRLDSNEVFAKVLENRGNAFDVEVPSSFVPKLRQVLGDEQQPGTLLASIAPQLRTSWFVLRNSLVVVSLERIGSAGKAKAEITNVVADKRAWQKGVPEWPAEWKDEQASSGLDLPPSWSDEEYEEDEDEDEDEDAENQGKAD